MYDSNAELIAKAQAGSKEALDKLVEKNMGLVRSIALRFRDRNVEYEDLVQIGALGMIKAINSFDFSFNTVFSTYAVPLIIGEIKKFLRDDGMIKVGRDVKKSGVAVMRQKEKYIAEHGKEPKISELCELCGISRDDLIYALEAVCPVRSLSEPIGDDEDICLGDTVADGDSPIEKLTDSLALSAAIDRLAPLQKEIVILRYFKDCSQQKTGSILGLTQVKVSREEKKILRRLKEAL